MLMSDRQVVYVPNAHYLGEDFFKYKLHTRNKLELAEGKVALRVCQCRSSDCATELSRFSPDWMIR